MKLFSILERLANAMERRNEIDRERLDFERTMYSDNHENNERAVKANEELVGCLSDMVDKTNRINKNIDQLDKNIESLYTNDMYFNDEIDKLKQSLVAVQEKINEPQ